MGKILFYAKSATTIGRQVQQIIEGMIPEGQIEICRTITGLSVNLRQPGLGLYINPAIKYIIG